MSALARERDDTAAAHWRRVHRMHAWDGVSWFEQQPSLSLALIDAARLPNGAALVDVGAGASTLVDALLARGHTDVTVLDIADDALAPVRRRLGDRPEVHYIVADVTKWTPERRYVIWHDRALFHFMTEEASRNAYRRALAAALRPGARAIIATFAEDGPEHCSALPVRRYSAEALANELSDVLRLVTAHRAIHRTPTGTVQPFTFGVFERR